MSFNELGTKNIRLFTAALASLLSLTIALHVVLLIVEVKTSKAILSAAIKGQVANLVLKSAQIGDLITLQQHLESIANPLSKILPIQIRISLTDNPKLLVDASSEGFSQLRMFQSSLDWTLMSNPFGEIRIETVVDYTHLVLTSFIKMILSVTALSIALWIARSHVIRLTKVNLVPIESFSTWLAQVKAEDIRGGHVLAPSEVDDPNLNKLLEEINALAKDLAQRTISEKLSEVATQTAHDIRSPLSALRLCVSKTAQTNHEIASLMTSAIERIDAIAEKLLGEYRRENNIPNKMPVTLRQILEPVLREKSIQYNEFTQLTIDSAWEMHANVRIDCNISDLQRAVSNLINNAIESIEDVGKVTVHAYLERENLNLSIIDTGNGMSPEVRARAGERGYSSKSHGNGLGLSHALKTATLLGGRLDIHSESHKGTRVTMVVPIVI